MHEQLGDGVGRRDPQGHQAAPGADGGQDVVGARGAGGNEQDALALASAFGLTWFEVLALPWPDCWRRARDAHEARR